MSLRLTKTELDGLTAPQRKVYFDLNEDGQIAFSRQYRGEENAQAEAVLDNTKSFASIQHSAESRMKEIGKYGFYISLLMSLAAGAALVSGHPIAILFLLVASLNGLFILMWIAGIIETRLVELRQAIEGKGASAV